MDTNGTNSDHGQRVTSTYAEIYFEDDYCGHKLPKETDKSYKTKITSKSQMNKSTDDESLTSEDWVSPSDLLIRIIELKPPFTSKITRGITHQGILGIGDNILEKEQERFQKFVNKLLKENDAAWSQIMEHEKSVVLKKVYQLYEEIFLKKSKIMAAEINIFCNDTLQDLENYMRKEVESVTITAHANIVSHLNKQIQEKLKNEKDILEDVLNRRYLSEVAKIKHYYKLLLNNEVYRCNKLIHRAIRNRNDALSAFYRQIDTENITSTMYVMSTERKKCRIKKFLLQNIQTTDIDELHQRIKDYQEVIDYYSAKEKRLFDVNKDWEEKIAKILQLFLKFLSFSLKLLPEQTAFLFDFEKMLVLQLNEMKKTPEKVLPTLVDEGEHSNTFEFIDHKSKSDICDKEPFVIEGDLSDSVPPYRDSRTTLPSDVDLPTIRLERQFVYAKCHKYEEIKSFLDLQKCKCMQPLKSLERLSKSPPESPEIREPHMSAKSKNTTSAHDFQDSESSLESLIINDVNILSYCPVRRCKHWVEKYSFPYLNAYLDFTEENYTRVKAILGKRPKRDASPPLLDPKEVPLIEQRFAATKEKWHHMETQYSSQEDLTDAVCPCVVGNIRRNISVSHSTEDDTKEIDRITAKRRVSMQRLLVDNPNLLKMFTDESFDFIYHIK